MQAILIRETGQVSLVEFDGGENAYARLKELVFEGRSRPGILEHVRLDKVLSMWGDEEAKLVDNHVLNLPASAMARVFRGVDYMAGNVVIVNADDTGETCGYGFPPFAARLIAGVVHDAVRMYNEGLLGKIERTGPHCEIRELTREELERMFGKEG